MSVTDPFTARATVGGHPFQVLADGTRTGGLVMFGEANLPPRSAGPQLHVHTREDEAFYVVAGTMSVRVGDELFEADAGTLVWLPRAVPHTFANRTDEPVRAVGVVTPAGLEGMFAEQGAYFATLAGPPDQAVIDEIGARYGVRRLGPPLDPTS